MNGQLHGHLHILTWSIELVLLHLFPRCLLMVLDKFELDILMVIRKITRVYVLARDSAKAKDVQDTRAVLPDKRDRNLHQLVFVLIK
jgi:hypothetical protein